MSRQPASPPPEIDLTGAYDPSTGMQYQVKRIRFAEIFRWYFDPDELAKSPNLPGGVQESFLEIFGDYARKGRVKLALHPWFRRWCMWELIETQAGPYWGVCQIFWKRGTKREGYLPDDLKFDDHRADDLRGSIGDYAPPDREWMLWYKERGDRHLLGDKEISRKLEAHKFEQFAEKNRIQNDIVADALDYGWQGFKDLANIEAGSGGHSGLTVYGRSHDELRKRQADEERIKTIQVGNIKYRVKPGSASEEYVLAKLAQERREQEADAAVQEQLRIDDVNQRIERALADKAARDAREISLGRTPNKPKREMG